MKPKTTQNNYGYTARETSKIDRKVFDTQPPTNIGLATNRNQLMNKDEPISTNPGRIDVAFISATENNPLSHNAELFSRFTDINSDGTQSLKTTTERTFDEGEVSGNILCNGHSCEARMWSPKDGCIANAFAYSIATPLKGNLGFVIGCAFDGTTIYFIGLHDLIPFLKAHEASVVFIEGPTALYLTTNACRWSFRPMIEAGLIRSLSIYYRELGCSVIAGVPDGLSLSRIFCEISGWDLPEDSVGVFDNRHCALKGTASIPATPILSQEYAAQNTTETNSVGTELKDQCGCKNPSASPFRESALHNKPVEEELLGNDIQQRGDTALREVERNGLSVDPEAVNALADSFSKEIVTRAETLARYGYIKGKPGNQNDYDAIIRVIEAERHVTIPITGKRGQKSQAAAALMPIADHEFVVALLQHKELGRIQNNYIQYFQNPENRIHPEYSGLASNDRTLCKKPNIQNLHKAPGVRECIVPPPKRVFASFKYSAPELCASAQITYARSGYSFIRNLINQGIDLNVYVATLVLGKYAEEITENDRQKAKAANHGFPRGMEAEEFQKYAQESFGVEMTTDEILHWRAEWFLIFPDIQGCIYDDDTLASLGFTLAPNPSSHSWDWDAQKTAAAIVLSVAGNSAGTVQEDGIPTADINWAWGEIEKSCAAQIEPFAESIKHRSGSLALQQAVIPCRTVSISTGRSRAECSYPESRTWSFQALADDGAKLALCDLIDARYRVVAFTLDEFLIEVPESDDYLAVAEHVSQIMVNAMRQVCPTVKIQVEYAVMRRWTKAAKATYDEKGRLIPYEENPE